MPNWCENNLSIYGKQEDMKKFIEVITISEGEYQLLEKLYPTPEELNIGNVSFTLDEQQKANLEKFGYQSWYDWRIDKWGTKWQESDLSVGQEYTENKDETSVIAFNFNTAWGPPIEAFNKIAQDYPNILFCLYYEEPGMGFCGRNVWGSGELQEEMQEDIISRWFEEDWLYEKYIEDVQKENTTKGIN